MKTGRYTGTYILIAGTKHLNIYQGLLADAESESLSALVVQG